MNEYAMSRRGGGRGGSSTHHQHRVDTLDLGQFGIQWNVAAVAQDAVEAFQSQRRQIIGQTQQRQPDGVSLPLDKLGIGAICSRGTLMALMMTIRVAQLTVTGGGDGIS